MMNVRDRHGLIDVRDYMREDEAPFNYPAPTALSGRPLQTIVFDSYQTMCDALDHTIGKAQKWMMENGRWDVDGQKWKLRQRLEEAGFEFEPLGHEYLDSPLIYRISRPRRTK